MAADKQLSGHPIVVSITRKMWATSSLANLPCLLDEYLGQLIKKPKFSKGQDFLSRRKLLSALVSRPNLRKSIRTSTSYLAGLEQRCHFCPEFIRQERICKGKCGFWISIISSPSILSGGLPQECRRTPIAHVKESGRD